MPNINPGLSADALEAVTFSDGAVIVELDIEDMVAVEFIAIPVKACKRPKYAGFLVTLAVMISPEPVPGKVEGIHEYYPTLARSKKEEIRTLSSKSHTVKPTQFFVARQAAAVV